MVVLKVHTEYLGMIIDNNGEGNRIIIIYNPCNHGALLLETSTFYFNKVKLGIVSCQLHRNDRQRVIGSD